MTRSGSRGQATGEAVWSGWLALVAKGVSSTFGSSVEVAQVRRGDWRNFHVGGASASASTAGAGRSFQGTTTLDRQKGYHWNEGDFLFLFLSRWVPQQGPSRGARL